MAGISIPQVQQIESVPVWYRASYSMKIECHLWTPFHESPIPVPERFGSLRLVAERTDRTRLVAAGHIGHIPRLVLALAAVSTVGTDHNLVGYIAAEVAQLAGVDRTVAACIVVVDHIDRTIEAAAVAVAVAADHRQRCNLQRNHRAF